jgi:CubicO group peptidase (beta-lactamase class C family)
MRSPVGLDSRCAALALAAVILGFCGFASSAGRSVAPAPVAAADAPATTIYPGASWRRIDAPGSVGWTRASLDRVNARLAKTPTNGFVAIVGGRALLEYGDVKKLIDLASVRKSLLSLLVGIHAARGEIRLDATLAELNIDDVGGLSLSEKEATVRDLLSARSGIYHEASNAGDDHTSAPPRGSQRHGTYFLYNNWDFNALGTIFEKQTGWNIYDAFAAEIAAPLGMEDFDRRRQRKSGNLTRSIHPAYHFHLSTRDLARVGYLMLREGNWAGRQVVPRDWVRESTRAMTHVSEMNPLRLRKGPFGYGYLWWVWDGPWNTGHFRGAFAGHGLHGQHVVVVPMVDLVVAHTTRPDAAMSHAELVDVVDQLIRTGCSSTPC